MSRSTQGFSLLEVLAAIVLTSLLAAAFNEVFATSRGSLRAPEELFATVAQARAALAQSRLQAAPGDSRPARRYSTAVKITDLRMTEIPDSAPPSLATAPSAPPASVHSYNLQQVDVVVTAPSGRRTELDGVTAIASMH